MKRVESVYRYGYIGIHDHRFRGQSLWLVEELAAVPAATGSA